MLTNLLLAVDCVAKHSTSALRVWAGRIALSIVGGAACATSGSSSPPPGTGDDGGSSSSTGSGNPGSSGSSSSGSGSSGGSTGSGGSSASSGSSGSGSSSGTGTPDASSGGAGDAQPPGDGAATGCVPGATARIHDDFESGSLNQWTVTDRDFNPFMGTQSTVTVVTSPVHGGMYALKIASAANGTGGLIGVAPPSQQLYGRAWVFMDADPGMGHWEGIVGVGQGRNGGSPPPEQIRLGGQFDILYLNASQTDGYFLSNPNFFTDNMGPRPPVAKWVCEEFFFGDDTVKWWITDAGMTPSATPVIDVEPSSVWHQGEPTTPWSPTYASIALGYGLFGATAVNVYYDDVAIDTSRICCDR